MPELECITSALGSLCSLAEYEWAYTGPEMRNDDGSLYWIPLCEECCAYWRSQQPNQKPYTVHLMRPIQAPV